MAKRKPNTAKLTIQLDNQRDREFQDKLIAVLTEIGVALHQLRNAINTAAASKPPRAPRRANPATQPSQT